MNNLTEMVELPSKGLLYNSTSSISSGKVELKYMTTAQEDILTNINYIKQRTVIDKLLQSLIVDKIDYNDLLVGDKNTIMIASRILGYGKDYKFEIPNPADSEGPSIPITIDLTTLNEKLLDPNILIDGKNEIAFTLPISKTQVTFKLLTHGDETAIEKELSDLKRTLPDRSPIISTRLRYTLLSVDGKRDKTSINECATNMLARDSKALRDYINQVTPNTELKYTYDFGKGPVEESIPIGSDFFWPE
jgi:hypothetical protein